LVVDDESNMRFVVRTILEGEGYTVIEAPNGAVALERTKASRPDVIVTDLMMPVMGGVDLIERLRADPTTAEISIVVLSASSLATSADIVLGKPFKPEILVEAVGSLGGKETE
jgi:CheY-like chemotaxis protein